MQGKDRGTVALLGQAIGMLPRFEVTTELELELDFKGLSQGGEIRLSGAAADYQRIEDALLGLARTASAVAGSLRLDFHFSEPCRPDGDELGVLRQGPDRSAARRAATQGGARVTQATGTQAARLPGC